MRAGVRLGKVKGIPILLDYSFFIALFFVTWLLATNVFPDRVEPEPSSVVAWGMAVIGAVVFFTSLLMHELAHSIAAGLYGLHVANITLFVLGGVSQIKEESRSAAQEFVIAFVGPLTSAVLGLGFIGLYVATGSAADPVPELLLWLGYGNLVIAIFNMLPGFPLDGGRVFRSALWGITGSYERSTRWAARVGQAFAALFVVYGAISIVDLDIGVGATGFGGLIFVLIGAFLYSAAAGTLRSLGVQSQLSTIHVRDVMNTQLRTVDGDSRVCWVAPLRDRIDPRLAYLVTSDGTVVGMATGASLLLLDAARYEAATMADVMIPAGNITPIGPEATGQEALRRLQTDNTPVLPVVEDGQLLGLVGLDQVAAALRPDGAGAS